MDLVLVQFVVLAGVVLDNPLLHGSLCGDDRRRVVVIEGGVNRIRLSSALRASRSHASGGIDEELASVLDLFKEHGAGDCRRHTRDAAESLLGGVRSDKSGNLVVNGWFVTVRCGNKLDLEQWPCGSIVTKRPRDDVLRHQLGDFNGWGWRVHNELDARGGRQTKV